MAEFGRPRLDYKGLEVEDFKRQVDQRRRDQFEFLAERSKEYALSPEFIDYAVAHFNYEWARLMISYPTNYYFANDHENRDLPPGWFVVGCSGPARLSVQKEQTSQAIPAF